ncbi:putative Fe-S oxidoreductase with radical SAM domain [Candidatus Nitrososphaera gargensis Ga9.2]|uniref:Putative Fe-S oxidoreductase with radical SAM domain n=1 Tax=Nitrososphaera gargensis (strain Ga9.2) TaxID=1237085 RepID=K0IHD5_NITGG|nr:radical SAM protein [Candidatus Nitrososphaera gargensis]AFU57172.1 putative Fe-S oxidoreductase with radical SAM domain [Candidatus Nitrososphaera gargensis Ga9.2]
MVDLIYGRSITDLIREMPFYTSLIRKMIAYRLFGVKQPLHGSVDVNNICNLHCTHCYWWLNRKEEKDKTVEDWRKIIKDVFNKQRIFITTLVGGEPTLRPDIIELFCKEMPKRVCVVTNGTFPLKRYNGLYFYWVSLDGTEKVHDSIRGEGAYAKTKKNILDYTAGPPHNGIPAWKEIWLSMTINSRNYMTVEDLIEEWRGKVNKIGLQFHTPFAKGDPLMLPFGELRNSVVDKLIALKKKYPNYIVNPISQMSLMKGNWGGVGTTPVDCPSWAILSLDHMGRVKQPCCIGSADPKSMKPICEECGLGCYSILVAQGIKGI